MRGVLDPGDETRAQPEVAQNKWLSAFQGGLTVPSWDQSGLPA